eukprot:scaffold29756_cov57-Phaeocystis_antarctica.AAC.3
MDRARVDSHITQAKAFQVRPSPSARRRPTPACGPAHCLGHAIMAIMHTATSLPPRQHVIRTV